MKREHTLYLTGNTIWCRRARPLMNSWGEPIRVRCRPYIIAPMYLRHSHSLGYVRKALPRIHRERVINSYLDHIMQISGSLSTPAASPFLSACLRPESVEKCRSHGKLFNFHEDKQDNGICSANWISRTVRLLEEVCCLSWFFSRKHKPLYFSNNHSLLEWEGNMFYKQTQHVSNDEWEE